MNRLAPDEPAPFLDRVALTSLGSTRFLGAVGTDPDHLFGGQVVAQALYAAAHCAPGEMVAYSLHAHFLLAGRGDEAVELSVEDTRDGTSFATRRVVAEQSVGTVLVLTASFQLPEPGVEYQVDLAHHAVDPGRLQSGRYESELFESRDVRREDDPDATGHRRCHWWRVRGAMPDDPVLHQVALAWASDHGPTRAARQPHAAHPGVERRMSVSLDHTVWFHRRLRVDDWLFTELRPMSTANGRGLSAGTVHDAAGRHVATLAQEVVLRLPD